VKKRWTLACAVALFFGIAAVAAAVAPQFHSVNPGEFDPGKTFAVQGTWLNGTGCPQGAITSLGCPTGDQVDKHGEGLVLAKTGPTATNASAFAELKDVKGTTLTELGYDIRKPGADQNDPRGSHCGAGAPRFNIETTDGTFFLGCNSPAPEVANGGDGWLRLRWGVSSPLVAYGPSGLGPITGTVQSIAIVFEGPGRWAGQLRPRGAGQRRRQRHAGRPGADHAELTIVLAEVRASGSHLRPSSSYVSALGSFASSALMRRSTSASLCPKSSRYEWSAAWRRRSSSSFSSIVCSAIGGI